MQKVRMGIAALLCAALCWGAGCAVAGDTIPNPWESEENRARLQRLLYIEPAPEEVAPGEMTSLTVDLIRGEELPDLAEYPKLEELQLLGFDQAQFETALAQAPNLRALVLDGCNLADLSPVLKLPRLTRLEIGFPADWSVLAGHPTLRELRGYILPEGSAMEVLRTMPALETVDVTFDERDDTMHLSELRSLRSLSLWSGYNESLPPLPSLKSLEALSGDMDGTAMLAEVAASTGLEALSVFMLRDGVDLSPLTALQELRELTLIFVGSQGSDLSPLGELPKLRSLIVSGPMECLNTLPEIPTLEVLRTGYTMDISLLKHTPALKELRIFCDRDTDLSMLKALPELEHLSIYRAVPDDLTPLHQLPALEYLFFDADVDDMLYNVGQLAELSRARPNVKIMLDE